MCSRALLFGFIFATSLSSCAADSDTDMGHISNHPPVTLTGRLEYAGEIMIHGDGGVPLYGHSSRGCISGVFRNHERRNYQSYHGKIAEVQGTLYNFTELPNEGGVRAYILPRKVLGGTIIINSCFGEKVMLISSIRILP